MLQADRTNNPRYPVYLPLFLSAAFAYQQARQNYIDPHVLDDFPPGDVLEVLRHANATALRHAEAQCVWRRDYFAEWWEIKSELGRVAACYQALQMARWGIGYPCEQERLRELRALLGPHLWRNRRLPKPVRDEWLCLFREMIPAPPELLPPPMPGVP